MRANFLAAQEDYSPPQSATNGSTENGDHHDRIAKRPAASIWTKREGNDFYIPTIDWSLSGLQEERSQYDITVKLFFLPGADVDERPRYTRDAVKLVCKELGVQDIDLLIVSFPGMAFEGDCEWEADRRNSIQGDDEEEIKSWQTLEELHTEGVVKRLGIAEFGSEKLARFLSRVTVRPEVDQVNVKDCCNVPPPLLKLAKAENVELYTHYDCSDILPGGTLRELLGQGENGAGVLSDNKRGIDSMKGDIRPEWVVKYTAVVSDRGVIENKGYFASAQLNE